MNNEICTDFALSTFVVVSDSLKSLSGRSIKRFTLSVPAFEFVNLTQSMFNFPHKSRSRVLIS